VIIAFVKFEAAMQHTMAFLMIRFPLSRRLYSVASVKSHSSSLVDEECITLLHQESSIATSSIGIRSQYRPIPPDIAAFVSQYSSQQPTAVSLKMLMKTGEGHGDFWGRTYHSASNKHYRTSSSNVNLMMLTSPWRRLGLGPQDSTARIQIQMADYLRKELPIRLSHRILDLDLVPHLRHMDAVQTVKNIYIDSFMQITSKMPPSIRTSDEEHAFASLLTSLYENHAAVLVQMAQGAYQLRTELRRHQKEQRRVDLYKQKTLLYSVPSPTAVEQDQTNEPECNFARMNECHQFLERFYMSRIGIRFLAGQYLTLRHSNHLKHQPPCQNNSLASNQMNHNDDLYIGMICQETSPSQCVRQATNDASNMCRRMYGRCPRVDVTGRLDLTFPYIPTYLHYILLELLKNALRATMETHKDSAILPPVQVVIADGTENEDVVIKVADEGGGIPRSQIDKIWSYLFTTANENIQKIFVGGVLADHKKDHSQEAPLAGLGYGLPISRAYCRYFGGDLDLISMEGYGTDAFVHLKRLGDTMEPVPI
jgi:pyruvate dehydrogenase kinase 2/3/4